MTNINFCVFIAIIFYIIIPLIGAIFTYIKHKKVKDILMKKSLIEYYDTIKKDLKYKINGFIENIDKDFIFIKVNDKKDNRYPLDSIFSISRNNNTTIVILLLNDNDLDLEFTTIKNIDNIIQNTPVFLISYLDQEKNLYSLNKNPIIMIIHYEKEDLIEKLIRLLRKQNYYFNNITPISLMIGSFIFIFLSLTNQIYYPFILMIIFILLPFSPLLPPGILLYFIYRKLMSKSYNLSSDYDIDIYNNISSNKKRCSILLKILAYLIIVISILLNSFIIILIVNTLTKL